MSKVMGTGAVPAQYNPFSTKENATPFQGISPHMPEVDYNFPSVPSFSDQEKTEVRNVIAEHYSDENETDFDDLHTIVMFFYNNGFPLETGAVFAAHAAVESGRRINPLAETPEFFGLLQWQNYTNPDTGETDNRRGDLESYPGGDTINGQLRFVIDELSRGGRTDDPLAQSRNVLERLRDASNLSEAFNASEDYIRWGHGDEIRRDIAEAIYNAVRTD